MAIQINQVNTTGQNHANVQREDKMKKNILHVTHITDSGIYHAMCFDMDAIRIYCIADAPLEKCVILHWKHPESDDDSITKVSDSYKSLQERIFGIKE